MTHTPKTNYVSVTEMADELVSQEQIDRLCHRYYWAGSYCEGRDVVEAACGSGQGLGYLSGLARSLEAGDYSEDILDAVRRHYGSRVAVRQFDAQEMPFENASKDLIILFEAIYYLPQVERFVRECARVLRPGGKVLVATANKDLYDFNPSPFSHQYFGAPELERLFAASGFSVALYGYMPADTVSMRQRVLRPVKMMAAKLGLIPKTTAGKRLLKRFVFGKLVATPREIQGGMIQYQAPEMIPSERPDIRHKVIYCEATRPA